MQASFRSPRSQHGKDMQSLRQLHKEFKTRAGDGTWQITKRKRLVRPFSQGDVGQQTLRLSQSWSKFNCLTRFCFAGFNPLQKNGSYEAAAAKLHEQISFDKPWYLLDPEVSQLQ